ncbi:glycoside hydrolase family 3 N-terminal domain-containing protein [soil metagenome]
MYMKKFLLLIFILFRLSSFCQIAAQKIWVDSVFNSLTDNERIAQLMAVRVSEKKSTGVVFYDDKVLEAISKYNIGGVVLFQGSPFQQAQFVNKFQSAAKTPLMVCVDAEWGLGMRFDSIIPFQKQMMLGAMNNASVVKGYGKVVAEQLKRAGIQVNYAPVVDVNNNPNNPVINDRSFGEDKFKVALYGIQYMKGLQHNGVLATAKHFPGHGDVSVDSHFDLPVINKTLQQLDSLELYPFRQIFKAGIGSVMIAHLYIPSIDSTPNLATSLSAKNVTGLLRNDLQYNGLTFTDALNMQGVAKFFPGGSIAVQALIAGNDMLCLPEDVPAAITLVKEAINNNRLTWYDIYNKCRKVLTVKYAYGSANIKPLGLENITNDINRSADSLRRVVAEHAITLLADSNKEFFPLIKGHPIAYVAIGINKENAIIKKMRNELNADIFYFNYQQDRSRIKLIVDLLKRKYSRVITGIHNLQRSPVTNFGLSASAIQLANALDTLPNNLTMVFGNAYAIKNFCNATNLVLCYEDDEVTQATAADLLFGKLVFKGTLPVTVCEKYPYGSGKVFSDLFKVATPQSLKLNSDSLILIDSIASDAIAQRAMPGCIVLVAKDGKIGYQKAFGNYRYDQSDTVSLRTFYDIASVTKIAATTIAIMKLYDEKKISLSDKISKFLPEAVGTNKENFTIKNVLLHQAGFASGIPLNIKDRHMISASLTDSFPYRIAEDMYGRYDWQDTLMEQIMKSRTVAKRKYEYSDLDFIVLGKIVESITKKPLDEYVQETFYDPMGLENIGFNGIDKFPKNKIAPTETDTSFRMQMLQGDVHDPIAAMFGGVSGNAGLFSTVDNVAAIMQMLVNNGEFRGKKYIKPSTIKLFTAYNSSASRRGLGFDKPEKDNNKRPEPYPSKYSSSLSFGHTGFTGVGVWADPKYKLVYVFLSNRIQPSADNNKLQKMNIRGKISDVIYRSVLK